MKKISEVALELKGSKGVNGEGCVNVEEEMWWRGKDGDCGWRVKGEEG